jgi:hypothetical protein
MSNATPVQLGRSHLGDVRHVCAFFNGDEEAWRVLGSFIAEGFACGDKAIHIVRPDREAYHLRRLAGAGIDPVSARGSGQLDLRHNTETYLVDGRFDQDRMLAAFEAMAGGNDNFPLSRIVCDMGWAADHPLHHEDLIEFEARVNDVWSRYDDVVICVYDLGTLSGDMVIDIMRTHPMVLIGEVLQENPFFTPPEIFLRERREARGDGSASS